MTAPVSITYADWKATVDIGSAAIARGKELEQRIRELEAENERMRTELEFFADESKWNVSFYGLSWSFYCDMDIKPWLVAQQAKEGEEQKP